MARRSPWIALPLALTCLRLAPRSSVRAEEGAVEGAADPALARWAAGAGPQTLGTAPAAWALLDELHATR